MPRRARLRIAGVPLHIVQRGNNRTACFYRSQDYHCYLDQLEKLARQFGCAVHAYVLMTNHVHLLITPSEDDSASLLMKHLGQRYVQYFNRVQRRSGTLWEGRFKSSLVQHQGYLFRCQRYIELNPVRAGIVAHPGYYAWSSYRVNAHLRAASLVTPHELYIALGDTPEHRADAYRSLLRHSPENEELKEIRSAIEGGFALGERRFKDEIAAMLGTRVERLRSRSFERAAARP